jgi:NAD-dependent DNA ligase
VSTSVVTRTAALVQARPPFQDHVVVFTGKLACLTRRAAQARVRELGGQTAADVTHRVTMLVVGRRR